MTNPVDRMRPIHGVDKYSHLVSRKKRNSQWPIDTLSMRKKRGQNKWGGGGGEKICLR